MPQSLCKQFMRPAKIPYESFENVTFTMTLVASRGYSPCIWLANHVFFLKHCYCTGILSSKTNLDSRNRIQSNAHSSQKTIETHVWPTCNVTINFAYWISLSYSWSSHAIQYSDFGIQCLYKMELDHWYISTVSGNLHSFYFVILQQQTA